MSRKDDVKKLSAPTAKTTPFSATASKITASKTPASKTPAPKAPASKAAPASPATVPAAEVGRSPPAFAKPGPAKPAPLKVAPVAAKPVGARPIGAMPVAANVAPAPAATSTKSAAPVAAPKPATAPPAATSASIAESLVAKPAAAHESAIAPAAAKPERKSASAEAAMTDQAPVPAKAEGPQRHLADAGLNRARDAFATFKTSSDRLTRGVEASARAGTQGMRAFGSSLFSAIQANTDAAFDYVKALASVKSLSEAVELQSRHAREQFEVVTAQAKELTGIANRAAAETAAPLREALDETFRKAS